MVTHKHHIVPRHAGGSNDPSNLIELTVEEHAEAHRILFEQHGRWQDEIAWLNLTGRITCEEARVLAVKKSLTGIPKSDQHKKNMSDSMKRASSKIHTKEASRKLSETMKRLGRRPPNSAGKVWITDGIKQTLILPTTEIPNGYRLGRLRGYKCKIRKNLNNRVKQQLGA